MPLLGHGLVWFGPAVGWTCLGGITNRHTPRGLKQQKCPASLAREARVTSRSRRGIFSPEAQGMLLPCLAPSFRRLPVVLGVLGLSL